MVLVVSRPDKRRGRGGGLAPSPVKSAAVELGVPVTTTANEVIAAGVELGVVVAYGRILKPPLLGAVPLVNVHFSLLPRWRGAAPVERAILAGDAVTGVCVMGLEAGLDTGPVYARAMTGIGSEETVTDVRNRLATMGRELLVASLAQGLGAPEAQDGEATYAPKIEAAELQIDWTRPTEELLRLIRLERAWTTWRGKRLVVAAAGPTSGPSPGAPGTVAGDVVATGNGALRLVAVTPEGRARVDAAAWARGARLAPGERLGGGGMEAG